MDPALVRYANMYVHRHEYFRWTTKTAWNTITFVVIIPSIIGYIGWKYDVRAISNRLHCGNKLTGVI